MTTTTIQVESSTLEELKEIRKYSRETYNEIIKNLISLYNHAKKHNQYDKFLHKIEQPKMKELWDNKEDEAWENA